MINWERQFLLRREICLRPEHHQVFDDLLFYAHGFWVFFPCNDSIHLLFFCVITVIAWSGFGIAERRRRISDNGFLSGSSDMQLAVQSKYLQFFLIYPKFSEFISLPNFPNSILMVEIVSTSHAQPGFTQEGMGTFYFSCFPTGPQEWWWSCKAVVWVP